MRVSCENCGQVQPPDWQPGNLCTNCGAVVRREKRCHWCVKLTPDGKFCRHCGAGQVPDEQYGAARWLKHLGTDQFALPERLAGMDPEQVTHFTRLYQRHAIVAERHVDDLAFAESFARQRGWARALEEHLLPLLPLPDADLQALMLPPLRGTNDAEKLLEIRSLTPFPPTRTLAALARLRYWLAVVPEYDAAFTPDLELATQALQAPDLGLRLEAALLLSHWRYQARLGGMSAESTVLDVLREIQPYVPVAAAVALALRESQRSGKPQPVPADALAAENADLAFAAALAAQVPEPLLAALRHPLRRFAASRTLVRTGVDFPLAALLPEFTADEQYDLLDKVVSQQRPRPDLRAYARAAAESSQPYPRHLRDLFTQLRLLSLEPGDAHQLLREMPAKPFTNHDGPDWRFINQVLSAPTLPAGETLLLCEELSDLNLFVPNEIPVLREQLQAGELPLSLAKANFRNAPERSRTGWAAVLTHWLEYGVATEALAAHEFMRGVVWDARYPAEARTSVFQRLQQWYRGYHRPDGLALAFTEPAATTYFGSFENYVAYFVQGLEQLPSLVALNVESDFLRPLQTAADQAESGNAAEPAALLAALQTLPAPLLARWQQALTTLAFTYEGWSLPGQWAVRVLALMQQHAPWRSAVQANLAQLQATGNDNVAYLAGQALSAPA